MRVITSTAKIQPQSAAQIMMIRPANFSFNTQTSESNKFQQGGGSATFTNVPEAARDEFELMVSQLQKTGIDVYVFDDNKEFDRPDAIFPNNWVSFHQSGKVVLYPMMAENRRTERRKDIIESLQKNFKVEEIIDLTYFENEGKYLEGTGSMVLDRRYKVAYACLSPRTHPEVLERFGEEMGYEIVAFSATDEMGNPIYHTNVMMCVGDIFAVVCLQCIPDPDERQLVRSVLEDTNKYIIELSLEQVHHFAGNMLMLRNTKDEKFLVMSTQAYESLSLQQKNVLNDYARILHTDLSTIEANGGGSARCMMTEIHLPQN